MRTTLATGRPSKCARSALVLPFLSGACTHELNVNVEPSQVDFGTVDFRDYPSDMPAEGYGSTPVTVTNEGEKPIILTMERADHDRLCVLGISAAMLPYEFPELDPGQSILVQLGVCAYLAEEGDRDTLIADEVILTSDKPPGQVSIPWSFTPTIIQVGDTGF